MAAEPLPERMADVAESAASTTTSEDAVDGPGALLPPLLECTPGLDTQSAQLSKIFQAAAPALNPGPWPIWLARGAWHTRPPSPHRPGLPPPRCPWSSPWVSGQWASTSTVTPITWPLGVAPGSASEPPPGEAREGVAQEDPQPIVPGASAVGPIGFWWLESARAYVTPELVRQACWAQCDPRTGAGVLGVPVYRTANTGRIVARLLLPAIEDHLRALKARQQPLDAFIQALVAAVVIEHADIAFCAPGPMNTLFDQLRAWGRVAGVTPGLPRWGHPLWEDLGWGEWARDLAHVQAQGAWTLQWPQTPPQEAGQGRTRL